MGMITEAIPQSVTSSHPDDTLIKILAEDDNSNLSLPTEEEK